MITRSYNISVAFGDCDPAGIVFYPNYYRWFDQCFHFMSDELGITALSMEQNNMTGMPLLEAGARFLKPSTAFETITIRLSVTECARKTVRVAYAIDKDGEPRLEGWEVRVWAGRHPEDPKRLLAKPLPEEVRTVLSA